MFLNVSITALLSLLPEVVQIGAGWTLAEKKAHAAELEPATPSTGPSHPGLTWGRSWWGLSDTSYVLDRNESFCVTLETSGDVGYHHLSSQ